MLFSLDVCTMEPLVTLKPERMNRYLVKSATTVSVAAHTVKMQRV